MCTEEERMQGHLVVFIFITEPIIKNYFNSLTQWETYKELNKIIADEVYDKYIIYNNEKKKEEIKEELYNIFNKKINENEEEIYFKCLFLLEKLNFYDLQFFKKYEGYTQYIHAHLLHKVWIDGRKKYYKN